MKVLIASTEDFIKRETTSLAADAVAGSSVTLQLVNTEGYVANDYLVVGYEGSETAELVQITSIGGENVVVGTLKLSHKSDEPVVKYRYNMRKFYGALVSGGSYTELSGYGSPVAIAVNDPQGSLLEYTGGEGYVYFKSTYWNSQTSEESSLLDANEVLADESLRYCGIYDIRNQAGLTKNAFITDAVIEGYRKQAENEVDSYLNAQYVLPLVNSLGMNEIPFLVNRCAILLAAGYWDYKEFGKDGEGVKWLGEARGILNKLQTPGGIQLLGSNKLQMATNTTSTGVQSFPNTVDNNNGPVRYFTMQQRF